jgi:transcriptional regulator with XRE-family HTH domain
MRQDSSFEKSAGAGSAGVRGRDCSGQPLGRRIVQLRERKGWDRTKLAELLGVSLERLKKWELGANLPSFGMLAPLARTLDVSIDELVTGEPAPAAGFSPRQKDEAKGHIAGLVRLLKLTRDPNGSAASQPARR